MVFIRHDERRSQVTYSAQQLSDLRRKLLILHGQQIVIATGFMALLAAAAISAASGREVLGLSRAAWWLAAGLGVAVLVVFNLTRWRCPGCGRFLGGRNHYASHCRTCGLPIRWWARSK
jgi:hypothetical protein